MSLETAEVNTPSMFRRLRVPGAGAAAWALAGVFALLAWQTATVHFNFENKWSALFCTSGLRRVPPELAGTRVFAGSPGFDGQFYRYVAHDPWMRRGWSQYMDAPMLRRARILLPASAWLLACGQDRYIDAAYIALVLVSVFLGAWWLGRWAELHGRHPAWGLQFLLVPATLISIERMTLDATLTAACAGILFYAARGRWRRACALLAAAALVRETGLLLAGGCFLYALSKRQWRNAVHAAAACLPACAWYAFLAARIRGGSHPGWWHSFFNYPLVGMAMKLFAPEAYPFSQRLTVLVQAVDEIALAGCLAAVLAAIVSLRHRPLRLEQWLSFAFLILVFAFGRPSYWNNVYNYARPISPLLLVVSLPAIAGRARWALAPILLIDLRIAAQWAPQAWGILRGL
jgi:hypothetical protein